MDMMGSNIFQLTRHQQLVGGLMIVIYSILMPRYFKLFSPMTAYLLGAVSYPPTHICESGQAVRLDWSGCDVADLRLLVADSGWADEVVSDLADGERVGACLGLSRDFTACNRGYAVDCE
jgi:hypothetical protein